MRTLYLNNSGHRWVNVDQNGNRDKLTVYFPEQNKTKKLAVKFWEAIGNFAVPYVRHRGKTIQLMESSRKPGTWTENNETNRQNRA